MPSASRRRSAVVLVATAALLALGGCATATPLCDQGDVLTEVGALGRATEAYARASRLGEGACADAGLTASGARYADAYVDVAQGRASEDARDLDAAVSAYRAALAVDDANTAARDALARLGQPLPAFRDPDPAPPRPRPDPEIGLVVAVSITGTVAACGLLGLLGWALWWWRVRRPGRRRDADAQVRLEQALAAVEAAGERLDEAREDLARDRPVPWSRPGPRRRESG